MKEIISHRCEESLNHNMSIRYSYPYESVRLGGDIKTWRLFHLEFNDYSYNYKMCHVTDITYCPFCGKKLGNTNG
ncbi:MAG: hypothetical protein ACRCTZ_21440 [Sarcina sp.]